jgi:hypothetical protein
VLRFLECAAQLFGALEHTPLHSVRVDRALHVAG